MKNAHPWRVGLVAWLLSVAVGASHAPGRGPGGDPEAPADPGLADFVRAMQTEQRYLSRFDSIRWSSERLDRAEAQSREWSQRLERVDFDTLTRQAKVDYALVLQGLAATRDAITLDRTWLAQMEPLTPFRPVVLGLESSRRRMDPLDAPAAAEALSKIPGEVKRVREAIERDRKAREAKAERDTPPEGERIEATPVVARRAAGATDECRRVLGAWAGYYEGYQPEASWWLRQPREQAERALDEFSKFLREDVAGQKGQPEDPLVGDPIGPEALAANLRTEMLAYTPAELIAIAEREFAWCEEEMRKASREMGLGEDWKAALAKVKAAHAPPGGQDRVVRAQAAEAVEFLKARDLVTIPPLCEALWRIEMLSPETQKTLPFAVYGGQYMGVSYPTDAMTHDDKVMSMRGNNRHFTRNVTPHELIPGHHLQGYMSERYRAYRRDFSTPFLVEGWALYWEMEFYDAGWAQGPEDRIGMLFWRMHRCARIIVSLKFHLGEMTPAAMVDFLVERVGHERFGATSEVRRFIGGDYSPLYQCGYMIGGLQMRALAREVVGAGAGRLSPKQFHDEVLRQGPIPIELIRAALTGDGPARDAAPRWRFAEP